ncbi:CotH kinase family protein [Myxococcus sp. CA033]|uniref:CotH kinase family protein n=1 Tax=Myxococcus sp. CA033 TaxID=2741516 RepID=UPI00157B8027|nr:CotH kinase family protein [Myxococcus sp. CA033]NTX41574.1 CotH kinase family protein [Myxococcus sp. CA033]
MNESFSPEVPGHRALARPRSLTPPGRRTLSGALALLMLSLGACRDTPREEQEPGEQVEEAPHPVGLTIDAMDNEQHVLRGGFRVDAGVVRVEVYEGSMLLGEAVLEGEGRWSIPWQPSHASEALEVIAYHDTGTENRTRLDFQRLSFTSPESLYASEALLTLPTSPDTTTRYTLDGSTPGPSSPVYTAPLALLNRSGQPAPLSLIRTNPEVSPEDWRWKPPTLPVTLGTVVRVQRFAGETPVEMGQARTYLIGQRPYTLPVLSLVTDAENFFDAVRGIYVPGRVYEETPGGFEGWGTGNYMQDGKDWERPVHVEWFEEAGTPVIAQNAGVRIHGSGSAALPQKSLRLYAKEDYGPELFQADIFPGHPLRDFKRLMVRTSGQDQQYTKLKDCVLQGLLRDTTLALQACRPTVVFLNGEYWGLHELRERYDEYYLASHHGLNRKDLVILENAGDLDTGEPEDSLPYTELLTYVREHDLSVPEHYAHVVERMDVEDFIDYHVAQLYFGNEDWPDNNVKFWRNRAGNGATGAGDGRWRWLLYDLDASFFAGPEFNSLGRLLHDERLGEPFVVLLRSLLKSPDFKGLFIARFRWHLENTFAPERVVAFLDAAAARLEPELPEHIGRWRYPTSMERWREDVQFMRDTALRRPAALRGFLEQELGAP